MQFAIITIIFLGCFLNTTNARTSCGALLVDYLEFACGTRGTQQSWFERLRRKYPNMHTRAYRHTEMPIPEHLLRQIVEALAVPHNSIKEKSKSATETKYHSRRSTASQHSRSKRRAKRDVVSRCCRNECSLEEVKARYCARY